MARHFDECIWVAQVNGKPDMIREILKKLNDFKGKSIHSAKMDKLGIGDKNAVKGKKILMVGGSFSAEDLASQCI